MATPKISHSVGNGGKNDSKDVKTVQVLLNGFVLSGQLGEPSTLTINGLDWSGTASYIEKFQKNVVGLKSPDGKIDVGGSTWKELVKPPRNVLKTLAAKAVAYAQLALWPVSDIKEDLWEAALNALVEHSDYPGLEKPHMVTFMDFRISRNEPRLWTVNLLTRSLIMRTWVAHGTNSGKGAIPTTFGDGERKTSLGAYVTRDDYLSSTLGHVETPQPALRLSGLEHGVNGRARERGVLFHAATYVNPPKSVGNSWGCFATPLADNKVLVPAIADGSFVYAFAG